MNEQIDETEGMTRSEISKQYWSSPEGRRQKKLNAEKTRRGVNKYYQKHGGTHSEATKKKISIATREGIARAEASGTRKPRKRVAPKDGLWDLRVAQVMKEFDFISPEAAEDKARGLLKEDKIKFYSKYKGIDLRVHNKIVRAFSEYSGDEMLVEIILEGIQPDFDLPQAMINKIAEDAMASGSQYIEEIFFSISSSEMTLWLKEREDFEKIIGLSE